MQIKEVKISNLLSFPYVDMKTFEAMPAISLYSNEGYQGVKIFIGNTASGKSNFMKIFEEFFATLIQDFSYSDDFFHDEKISMRKAIQSRPNFTKYLQTNNTTPNKPSKLEITLELSDADYENIGFVCKYTSKINSIIDKYSKLGISFPQYKLQNLLEKPRSLKLSA